MAPGIAQRPGRKRRGFVLFLSPVVFAPGRAFHAGIVHQTFSTSARPRRPVGMKINAMIRIENAATSLYSTLK